MSSLIKPAFVIGIVGVEEEKLTPETRRQAIFIIDDIIQDALCLTNGDYSQVKISSGHCHLGGIDILAEERAKVNHVYDRAYIFPPARLQWEGGYKQRNLKIAQADIVHCITVDKLPASYTSKFRFPTCYHCKDREPPHVKSGGCWTMWQCKGGHKLWILKTDE